MSTKDLSKIRLFAMDVDGTLTDGGINISNDGELFKSFKAKDGMGITLLRKKNIIPAIITGRTSSIVENRCKELHIKELYQGISDKASVLRELADKYQLTTDEIAYIGDDLNDIGAMKEAGIVFAPADCAKAILPLVDFHLTKKAGDCPVREAIDLIMDSLSVDYLNYPNI